MGLEEGERVDGVEGLLVDQVAWWGDGGERAKSCVTVGQGDWVRHIDGKEVILEEEAGGVERAAVLACVIGAMWAAVEGWREGG